MPEPIADYSPEAIIEAIETNLVYSTLSLGRGMDSVVFRGSDANWVYTGYAGLNRVLRSRFLVTEAEDRVASIAACFARWSARVSWFVGPTSFPPEVSDYLKDSGFAESEIWMGTAGGLSQLRAPGKKSALRITTAGSEKEFQDWTSVSNEHWNAADGADKIFTPDNAGSDPNCRFYLGYVGDEPVVRGLSCVRDGVVGLYWVSVKSEHRNIAYDVALATRALLDARDKGARIGVMTNRGTSDTLASKLKFKPYCQFQVFTWPAVASRPLC